MPLRNLHRHRRLLAPVTPTHAACGREVSAVELNATLGLPASASRHNASFLTPFHERYDPIVPRGRLPTGMSVTDHLNKGTSCRWAESLTGCEWTHAGEQFKP